MLRDFAGTVHFGVERFQNEHWNEWPAIPRTGFSRAPEPTRPRVRRYHRWKIPAGIEVVRGSTARSTLRSRSPPPNCATGFTSSCEAVEMLRVVFEVGLCSGLSGPFRQFCEVSQPVGS